MSDLEQSIVDLAQQMAAFLAMHNKPGATGPTGPAGPAGPKGATGPSAPTPPAPPSNSSSGIPVLTADPTDTSIKIWVLLGPTTYQLCVRGPQGIMRK